MPFETGKPKTGGRAVGVQNKNTTNLKSTIQLIVEKSFLSIESDLQEMESKDRVAFVLKLAEFILPKMRETKLNFSDLSDIEIDELINRLKSDENE